MPLSLHPDEDGLQATETAFYNGRLCGPCAVSGASGHRKSAVCLESIQHHSYLK